MSREWLMGARGVLLGRSLPCTDEHAKKRQWSETPHKKPERMASDARIGAVVNAMLCK